MAINRYLVRLWRYFGTPTLFRQRGFGPLQPVVMILDFSISIRVVEEISNLRLPY